MVEPGNRQFVRLMKLAIIYDVAYPFIKGGAQRRFYEIGSRLSQNGWKVDWFTFKSWTGDSRVTDDGINYIGMADMPDMVNQDGKRNKTEPLLFLFHIVKHLRLLKQYQCIWAGQWPVLYLIPIILLCRTTGIPLVVDWWEVWGKNWHTYSPSVGWIGRILERFLLRSIADRDIIVTDCNLELDRIRAIVGSEDRILYIPNGIPWTDIGKIDQDVLPEFDIGSLGRLKRHKRVDLLLESIWHLREHHGVVATAAIIGDGPEQVRLKEIASELELGEQVTFFGRIPESSDCYSIMKRCRLCVISTVSGGGGNLTLMEAYGCGLPVVAFRCEEGIDPDLVDHGESGLLIEPADGESLAAGLAHLLQNPELVADMKRFVLSKSELYDWSSISNQYLVVFEKARTELSDTEV